MNVLMFQNWNVFYENKENEPPNYWFFKYWPPLTKIKVVGIKNTFPSNLENRIFHFYLWQTITHLKMLKEYDIVLSYDAQSGLFLSFLRMLGFKTPPHILFDLSLPDSEIRYMKFVPAKTKLRALKKIISPVDVLIYHTSMQKEYYEKTLGIKRAIYVPLGIDPEVYKPKRDSTEGEFILASAGKMRRDINTLLKVCPSLKKKCIITGIGGTDTENMTFKPLVSGIDFLDILDRCAMVIITLEPSLVSSGQLTTLQSMAMERPLIVTRAPPVMDYVENWKTGILVPPYDAKSILEAVDYLLDNPSEAKRIGKNARKAVLEKFTEERMGKEIYKIVEDITGVNR